MTGSEKFFRGAIRVVFLGAYGAFLWASLHHIAFFFHSFEPDQTDWTGSYWLAISIDVTALVMTTGVMFFRKGMGNWSFAIVWFFILGLTSFSWVVNWEYAVQFQNGNLSRATDFQWINPILASSFAFLNLVYSIVGEFFNAKPQTADDLDQEIARLQALNGKQKQLKELQKGTGLIQQAKEKLIEVKDAANEVFTAGQNELQSEINTATKDPPIETVKTPELEQVEIPSEVDIEDGQNEPQAEYPDDVLSVLVKFPKVQSWLTTSQRTATIEQVAEVTGLSKRRVVNRVKDGTLKRNSRNQNLVHVSSVIEYLKTDPIANRLNGDTGAMPVLQLVGNR